MAKVAHKTSITTTPGRELPQWLRDVVRRLVRDQGWQYEYSGSKHARIYNPQGDWMPLPTTIFDGPVRHKYLANLRRLGADLSTDPARERRTVVPLRQPDDMGEPALDTPWSDSEWRELQRSHDSWWRRLYAGDPAPEPEDEPALPPTWSRYQRELMDRLARGAEVKDDARGDKGFTLADARAMVRDGYSLDHVIARTGWGRMWLADLAERLDNS